MTTPRATRPDGRGDGDGWVECDAGHRHWGRYGAAGLLVHRSSPTGGREVLLQHRAEWSHFGGTWGLLGGARTSTETVVRAALREAAEEGAVHESQVRVHGRWDDVHGGWSYATVLATAAPDLAARPAGGESISVAWHAADRLHQLPLHPGFASSWPLLAEALQPLSVVVDVANVMGARPDGWWRDRVGAARRILDACARLATTGVSDADLPADLPRRRLVRWWPRLHLVVEGDARAAAKGSPREVDVVVAGGSGDDAVVERAAALPAPTMVVTADRDLRRRCSAVGATTIGPRWLWRLVA